MVVKGDQEKIKTLIKDTITLLCRNGLTFKNEFSIEALIGITLDKDDVFLVNINEIIRTELGEKLAASNQQTEEGASSEEAEAWDDASGDDTSQIINSPSRKRRRKRKQSADADASNASFPEDLSSHSEPPSKKESTSIHKNIKHENDEDSNDLVFVKQEVDNDWNSRTFLDHSEADRAPQQQDIMQGSLLPTSTQGINTVAGDGTPRSVTSATSSSQNMQMAKQWPWHKRSDTKAGAMVPQLLPLVWNSPVPPPPSPTDLRALGVLFGNAKAEKTAVTYTRTLGTTPTPGPVGPLPLIQNLMSPPLAPPVGSKVNAAVTPVSSKLNLTLPASRVSAVVSTQAIPHLVPSFGSKLNSPLVPPGVNTLNLLLSPAIQATNRMAALPRRPQSVETILSDHSSSGSMTVSMDLRKRRMSADNIKTRNRRSRSRSSSMTEHFVPLPLKLEQEADISLYVQNMQNLGFTVKVSDICDMAWDMSMKFNKKMFGSVVNVKKESYGPDWWTSFLSRRPELTEKDGLVFVLKQDLPKSE